jgi:two-component system response regulator YesN
MDRLYKVLIIDDDKLERKGLISIVPWENLGLTVVGDVPNGMLALQFLESHEVDLAVVDISMPVLSGLDFIQESRKRWPSLTYVVLSFHEDFEYIQQALRLGALDYISKLRLEEEDCAEVFRRIAQLMRLSKEPVETTTQDPIEQGLPETALSELRTLWCGLLWVYDGERFQQQLEALSACDIGLRQLERLLMWVSQEVEKNYGIVYSLPYLAGHEEGTRWLGALYELLHSREQTAGISPLLPACMLRAVRYIRDHLTERLKAEEVAHEVNMSRSYFSTSFKGVTGYNFSDYLQHERVELAKRLLEGQKIPLQELAEAVGYEDSKHFSRVFFSQTGVHCSEYMKQHSPR